jgi:hypothetical protein
MRRVAVNTQPEELDVPVAELLVSLSKSDKFGCADRREITSNKMRTILAFCPSTYYVRVSRLFKQYQ